MKKKKKYLLIMILLAVAIVFLIILLTVILSNYQESSFDVKSYTSKDIIINKVRRRFDLINDGTLTFYPSGSFPFFNEEWKGGEGNVGFLVLMEEYSAHTLRQGKSCTRSVSLQDEKTILIEHYVSTLDQNWQQICLEKAKVYSIWTAVSVLNVNGGYTISFNESLDFEENHEVILE